MIAENTVKFNDLNDFVFFLQGKYRDQTDLKDLRGKKVQKLTEEITNLKSSCEEKDYYMMQLYNENNFLQQQINSQKQLFEEKIQNFNCEIERLTIIEKAAKNQSKKVQEDFTNLNEENLCRQNNLNQAEEFIQQLKKIIERKDVELGDLIQRIKQKDQDINIQKEKIINFENLLEKMNPVKINSINQEEENVQKLQLNLYQAEQRIRKLAEENELLNQFRLKSIQEKQRKDQEENQFTHNQKNTICFDKGISCQINSIDVDCQTDQENLIFLDQACLSILQCDTFPLPMSLNSKNIIQYIQEIQTQSQDNLLKTQNLLQEKQIYEQEIHQQEERTMKLKQKMDNLIDQIKKSSTQTQHNEKLYRQKIQELEEKLESPVQFKKENQYSQTEKEHMINFGSQIEDKETLEKEKELQAKLASLKGQLQEQDDNLQNLKQELLQKDQQIMELEKSANQNKISLNKFQIKLEQTSQYCEQLEIKNSELKRKLREKINEFKEEINSMKNSNMIKSQESQTIKYQRKVAQLEKELQEAQNKQLNLSQKFYLELMSPQETVIIFKQFLEKIIESKEMLKQIKKSREFKNFCLKQ